MATLKQRLHKKNSSGTYDVVHLETSASLVLMSDGTTAEAAINGKAASSHNHSASNITSGTLKVARGGTGVTSLDALKSALGIGGGGSSGASYYFGTLTVGKRVWFNYEHWRCVHISGSTYYLILDVISQSTQFSSSNSSVYKGSTIAALCTTFQNDMAADSLAICVNTKVNGVTSKVFVPSCGQCTGEFSYFATADNRIARIGNQTFPWWTSSQTETSSFVWYVNDSGNPDSSGIARNTFWFRPCVAVQI